MTDPSLPTATNITVTFVATNGNLTLSTSVNGGLIGSQITGNGTSSVSVTGTLAEIDATLAATSGLGYQSVTGFAGTDSVTIHATDTATNAGTGTTSLLVVGPMSITAPDDDPIGEDQWDVELDHDSVADPSLPTTETIAFAINAGHGTLTFRPASRAD